MKQHAHLGSVGFKRSEIASITDVRFASSAALPLKRQPRSPLPNPLFDLGDVPESFAPVEVYAKDIHTRRGQFKGGRFSESTARAKN